MTKKLTQQTAVDTLNEMSRTLVRMIEQVKEESPEATRLLEALREMESWSGRAKSRTDQLS